MKAWQTTDGSHQVFSAHSWSNSCTMVYKYNRYAFLKVTRNIVPCPNLASPLIFCQIFYRQFEITNCIRNLAIHDSSKWRERERERRNVFRNLFSFYRSREQCWSDVRSHLIFLAPCFRKSGSDDLLFSSLSLPRIKHSRRIENFHLLLRVFTTANVLNGGGE